MQSFYKLSARLVLLFILTMGGMRYLNAQEIQSFQIRAGTLEPIDEPDRRGYVFRWSGGEQMFIVRRDEHLTSKGVEMVFPYPADLRPIGFKLDNGVEYLFQTADGMRSEVATAQAAAAEHPNSKVAARLFQGEAASRLEIAVAGPTLVYRTDVKIGGRDMVLWANRKPEAPVK